MILIYLFFIDTSQRKPMIIDPNEKYTYKTLALFSIYIFCALGLLIFTFLCIKSRSYTRQHMLKNNSSGSGGNQACSANSSATSSLVTNMRSLFASLDQTTKSMRSRVSIYFGSICPTTMRFVRVASNQPNAGYSGMLITIESSKVNFCFSIRIKV